MSTTKATDEVTTADGMQQTYGAPKVIAIGEAVNLLQGSSGKHTDGSTGWYWNEEG